jgi:aspartyl protease family protein
MGWSSMRQIVVIAALIVALGALFARYADRLVASPSPAATTGAAQPAPPANYRSVVLTKGDNGHFHTEARVDGRRVEFVVDTGATQIALRESDAARLGFHPTPRDYSIRVHTANGMTRAAVVRLRMVEIGGIVVRDLPALVHPDEALGVNLLGMSFLSQVRFNHDRGKLVIEQ